MSKNTVIFLLSIAVLVLVVANWSKIAKALSPSTYAVNTQQQCLDKNKALTEGAECTTCGTTPVAGTIQGGICTPPITPQGS